MIVLFFVLTMASGMVVNLCYKRAGALKSGPILFNFLFSLLCAAGCGVLVIRSGRALSAQTAAFGIVTGAALAIAAVLYIRALACGPFVLSTALFTASSLLPVAYCAVYPGEKLSVSQMIGYVLLMICCFIFTQNGKRAGDAGQKPNVRWMALILLTVLVNSLIPYGIRLQAQAAEGESVQMLFCYFAAAAVLNLLFACKDGSFRKGCAGAVREALPTAAVMAAAISLNTWAQVQIGANNVPAAIQYPVVNAGMLWLMALAGRILYGEKISWKNACALTLCAAAGVLTSL